MSSIGNQEKSEAHEFAKLQRGLCYFSVIQSLVDFGSRILACGSARTERVAIDCDSVNMIGNLGRFVAVGGSLQIDTELLR